MSRVVTCGAERGVRSFDDVFHQRRDVDQRHSIPDGLVLVIDLEIVTPDNDVACPPAPILRQAEARCALMERRAFQLQRLKHRYRLSGQSRMNCPPFQNSENIAIS
jgi:hypothetical protein